MNWDPKTKRQKAIEAACRKANEALWTEWSKNANSRLALARALETIERERMAYHRSLSRGSTMQDRIVIKDCIDHLRAAPAPLPATQPPQHPIPPKDPIRSICVQLIQNWDDATDQDLLAVSESIEELRSVLQDAP